VTSAVLPRPHAAHRAWPPCAALAPQQQQKQAPPEWLRAWVEGKRAALRGYQGICAGGALAGQAAGEDPGRRFRWLTAPRSTIVQPGPIHTGLTADPEAEADRLLDLLVR
jgi:hypothetical protein